MTTAARPTWYPAVGGNTPRDTGRAPTFQVSSKEVVFEGPLKLRHTGQIETAEVDISKLKEIQEQRERESFFKKRGLQEAHIDEDVEAKKRHTLEENPDADADVVVSDFDSDATGDGASEYGSSDSEGESDADDEEEEILRELEKVKKEREEERLVSLNSKAKEEQERREKAMMLGNSLLVPDSQSFSVSRKWYDDTIFKNQARGVRETPKKRFVGDMLRSDFHRKFMNRYMR